MCESIHRLTRRDLEREIRLFMEYLVTCACIRGHLHGESSRSRAQVSSTNCSTQGQQGSGLNCSTQGQQGSWSGIWSSARVPPPKKMNTRISASPTAPKFSARLQRRNPPNRCTGHDPRLPANPRFIRVQCFLTDACINVSFLVPCTRPSPDEYTSFCLFGNRR